MRILQLARWLLLPLVLLVLVLSVLLLTQPGGQWLLRQVPGLSTQGFSGTLLGEWSAQQLVWQNRQTRVEVRQANMAMDLRCLWRGSVCLERLQAQQLLVVAPRGEATASAAIQLPELRLPLGIELNQFKLQQLILNGQPVLQNIELQASWREQRLHIRQLALAYQEYQLTADGWLQPQQDWPVQLQLQAKGDISGWGRQQVALQLTGTLQQTRLQAQLDGMLAGTLSGQLQPLAEQLSASLALQLTQVQLQPWLGDMPLSLQDAQLALDYQAPVYQVQLQSHWHGPAGDFPLAARLQGDHQQLEISRLQLLTDAGQLTGQAELEFADELRWQAGLQLDALNPAYWLADLPGSLSGRIDTRGTLAGQLQTTTDIQLAGVLREASARFEAQVQGAGQRWQLPRLLLQWGDNQLAGSGQLDEALSASLQLDAAKLAQLLPALSGGLQGQLQLTGSLQQPAGTVQLKGRRFAYQDYRLQQMELRGQLAQDGQAQITLEADGLRSGEMLLGRVQVLGQGTAQEHLLSLDLDGPVQLHNTLRGSLNTQGDWQGELAQLRIQYANQQWHLADRLAISYLQKSGQLKLAAHCLRSASASLCAGQQQLLPTLDIDYRLRQFPLADLQPWLPPDTQVQALLNGHVRLQQQSRGLQGDVLLDAGQGRVQYQEGEQLHDFAWQQSRLEMQLTPGQISAQLELKGADSGQLSVTVALDPRPVDKPLDGEFRLVELQLASLRPFLPELQQLQGMVKGQGRIGGTLLQPSVVGQIELTDGLLAGDQLPFTVEALQLQVGIDHNIARLQGGWRSGDEGVASLNGHLQWDDGLAVDIGLHSQQLPVQVAPYADLLVATDLRLRLNGQGWLLSGRIDVPKGAITVPHLPEQAVRVSPDAQVLGRDQQPSGQPLAMDVEIRVGQERLQFSGFGLTANVGGQLQLVGAESARGVLELKDGRYRAYGQRLQLRRARLVFSGPISQPYIDIEAVRVTGDVTAGIRLSGLAQQPHSEIFSQPAMSQEQALSWLLLGRPLEGSGEDSSMLAQAALAIGIMGSSPVINRVADVLGIRDFELDTEGSGLTSSLVASGRITDRLVLSYGMGVFQPSGIVSLKYELTRRLYLVAASSLSSSLDLFYRRSF